MDKRLGEITTPYEKYLQVKQILANTPKNEGKVIYAGGIFLRKRNEAVKVRLQIQSEEDLCQESQKLLAQSMHGLTERW